MKATKLTHLRKWLILLIIYPLLLQAQQPVKPHTKKPQAGTATLVKKVDVYVGGAIYNKQTGKHTALYWKNGLAVPLTDWQSDAEVSAMAIAGTTVYACGTVDGQAVYWKNGQINQLTNTPGNWGRAYAIAVSDGDVYVAGYERDYRRQVYDIARYWKNGTPVELPTGGHHGCAFGIAVAYGDVYVVGTGDEFNGSSGRAAYWKNGERMEALNSAINRVYGISIIGSEVYIMGAAKSQAAYWKNKQNVILTNRIDPYSDYANAASVAVEGKDVYIAGQEDGKATYWKNGTPVILGKQRQDPPRCSIAVSGNDVYVAGVQFWKNGVETELPKGDGTFTIANCVVLGKAGITTQKTAAVAKPDILPAKPVVAVPPAPATPAALAEKFMTENSKKSGVISTGSGLQYEVLHVGSGSKPGTGDSKATFNFKRTIITGDKIQGINSSSHPLTMAISTMLPGLAEGIGLMNTGSKFRLTFPAGLGLPSGKSTYPEGAVLIFEVELLGFEN